MGFHSALALKDSFEDAGFMPGCSLDWDFLQQQQPATVLSLFENAFYQTGCRVNDRVAPAGRAPAAYLPFIYAPDGGGPTFSNEILLNRPIENPRTPEQIAISKRHEKIHAIQWNTIPALHASPYNQGSSLVLSPESWILMTILTERDAFVKTAWLTALELRTNPSYALAAQAETEALKPTDINFQTGDIRQSLQDSSTAWDNRIKHKSRASDPDMTLLDHYIRQALEAYEGSNRLNARNPAPTTFVRLSPADILAMGASFGPSIFGQYVPDSSFMTLPTLKPELQARLEALNAKHGITSEAALPTFAQALQYKGLSDEAYMGRSKAYLHNHPRQGQVEQTYEVQTPHQI